MVSVDGKPHPRVSTRPAGPAAGPHVSVSQLTSSGLSNLVLGNGVSTGVGILRKEYVASHL